MVALGATPTINPQDFIDPATADSIPNAYFIGPFGRRVSFASQQRRVLNTIWALEHTKALTKGERVAVVGAGLAGVTAAVALAARNIRVSLFETMPRALNKQARTNHRYIHPTINFWPEEAIGYSTILPFFDWSAGKCEDVVNDVFQEWELLLKSNAHLKLYIKNFRNNRKVRYIKGTGSKVQLVLSTDEIDTFDAAIITTGFGDETILPGTNTVSYWIQDFLEDKVRDSEQSSILVSGTGDGGLIDMLRILHRDFNLGRLCIEIAEQLSAHGSDVELNEIERSSKDTFLREAYVPTTATADEIKAATERGEAAAAVNHHNNIEQFVANRLPDSVKKLINESLINNRRRTIELVGLLPHPFSVGAAPIHKLLIAHALFHKIISYQQAKLDATPTGLSITPKGEAPRPSKPDYSIARHGSSFPITDFITDTADLARLRRKQDVAESWTWDGVFPNGFYGFAGYPPHDASDIEFIESRVGRARRYFDDVHEASTRPNFRTRCFVVTGAKNSEALPSQLFGITVTAPDKRRKFKSAVRATR